MKNKKFQVYSDPGHGWVKVEIKELDRLGIVDKITPWSYMRGGSAYLEEDSDASTFVEAYKAAFGKAPSFKEHHGNRESRIRNYPRFNPSLARHWIAS